MESFESWASLLTTTRPGSWLLESDYVIIYHVTITNIESWPITKMLVRQTRVKSRQTRVSSWLTCVKRRLARELEIAKPYSFPVHSEIRDNPVINRYAWFKSAFFSGRKGGWGARGRGKNYRELTLENERMLRDTSRNNC